MNIRAIRAEYDQLRDIKPTDRTPGQVERLRWLAEVLQGPYVGPDDPALDAALARATAQQSTEHALVRAE